MPRYIDADKLIAEFEWIMGQQSRFDRPDTEDTIERIRKMPTEDVAPVRYGHWQKTGAPCESGFEWRVCSRCRVAAKASTEVKIEYLNFCPNCGAKMGQVQDGENVKSAGATA